MIYSKVHREAMQARREQQNEESLETALKNNEQTFLSEEWAKVDDSVKRFIEYQVQTKNKKQKHKEVE